MQVSIRPVKLIGDNYEVTTLDQASALGIYREDSEGLEQHVLDITRDDPNFAALAEAFKSESEVKS